MVVEINLHELVLDDAIDTILDKVEELYALGAAQVVLVHGHHHGQLIKQWIWSPALETAMKKLGITLTSREYAPKNPGATVICFK